MFTRQEVMNMSDMGLTLAYDRTIARLAKDWRAGQPGRLSDVYNTALLRVEADLRCLPLRPLPHPGQMTLDLQV